MTTLTKFTIPYVHGNVHYCVLYEAMKDHLNFGQVEVYNFFTRKHTKCTRWFWKSNNCNLHLYVLNVSFSVFDVPHIFPHCVFSVSEQKSSESVDSWWVTFYNNFLAKSSWVLSSLSLFAKQYVCFLHFSFKIQHKYNCNMQLRLWQYFYWCFISVCDAILSVWFKYNQLRPADQRLSPSYCDRNLS